MTKRIQSPTSINTYLRCPRRYYLKYVLGLREKPGIHLIRGQVVHSAIARFTSQGVNDGNDCEALKANLLDLFDRSWLCRKEEIKALGMSKEAIKEIYDESALMLSGWLERYLNEVAEGSEELEVEIKLISEKFEVMGFIDAVRSRGGRVFLIDYKTSKSDEMTRETRVQMAIYALLFKETFGMLPEGIIIDFLKHQSQAKVTVTEQLIADAARLCREIHDKTSSDNEGDYPCTCEGRCQTDFA